MKRMRNKKELHLVHVFGAIFLSNTVAWLPFTVTAILSLAEQLSDKQRSVAFAVSYILFVSQVVLHPLLETAFVKEVRQPLIKMMTCAYFHKKRDHSPNETPHGKIAI